MARLAAVLDFSLFEFRVSNFALQVFK